MAACIPLCNMSASQWLVWVLLKGVPIEEVDTKDTYTSESMHFTAKFLFYFAVDVMQFSINCQFIFYTRACFITQMKTDCANQTDCKSRI